MIAYINGKVLSIDGSMAVIENNGIGFEINCTKSVLLKLSIGKSAEVYSYLSVREDGMYLYGFDSLREKAMFLKLISVSGIGPKMGMTVLSGMGLSELAYAIASSDVSQLSSIKGLGKKTAERIILELREAISKTEFTVGKTQTAVSGETENAILALMSLGYTKAESNEAVMLAKSSGFCELEALITAALKSLART